MVQFGSFDDICQTAALVVCPLVGELHGIEPNCYSRNVEIANTVLFQPGRFRAIPGCSGLDAQFESVPAATCFVHIVAMIMTGIMIYHIRSKYTAVGRKEIVMFFWLYAIIELLAMFLDSGIIPTANDVYPVRPCPYGD